MSVTYRFVLLVAAGILLTALAWPFGLHTPVFILYNLLLGGLFVLDTALTPSPAHALSVRRVSDARLYIRTDNEIAFVVTNRARYTLKTRAKDEINDRHFSVTGEKLAQTLTPGGEALFAYTVTPSKRGAYRFDNIHFRCAGVLGLCEKFAVVPCPFMFSVYPNLTDLSKYRLMTQKNRLLPQGNRTVRLYGVGAEFESLRAYVEGDDYRKMNWMATARENRLIVNQFQVEKNQPVFILLDTGRPMSYTVGGYKKLDYAIDAALILSDIVNRQGDQSGLMIFNETVRTMIMPGKGAAHRNQIMESLYLAEESRKISNYESAFRLLCERQKRRALVFIFTDFDQWEEAETLTAHIKLLSKRHWPFVACMKNDALHALAIVKERAYDRQERVLQNTARALLDERAQIYRKLNALRIPHIECEAERFAASAVNRYMALRNQ